MFAVFLARPCPFYILDEVEAALDDINIDRFLQLVKRYSDRAQFIVVTHQKRTMDAADTLYGVSMGGDGISRVVSRKLAGRPAEEHALVVRRRGRRLKKSARPGPTPPVGDQTYGGAEVRGRTIFLALVAVLSLLCATAVAFAHDGGCVQGTKGADELTADDGNNRVFARAGDDTVDGGARQRPAARRQGR